MRVTKVTGYEAADGSLWETEREAIDCNINTCLDKLSHKPDQHEIKTWLRDNKTDIRYILSNIDKMEI